MSRSHSARLIAVLAVLTVSVSFTGAIEINDSEALRYSSGSDMDFRVDTNGKLHVYNDVTVHPGSIGLTGGNIGIGTTSPSQQLDVAGSAVLNSGTAVNEFSTDESLADNSDDALPTEQAVRSYVDGNAADGACSGQYTFLAGDGGCEDFTTNTASFINGDLISSDSVDQSEIDVSTFAGDGLGGSADSLAVNTGNALTTNSDNVAVASNSIQNSEIDNSVNMDFGSIDISGGAAGDGSQSGATIDSSGNLYLSGSLNFPGDVNIVDQQVLDGSFLPDSDNTFNLGSGSNRWKNAYLSNQIELGGRTVTEFSRDEALSGNSDSAIPTEQAVKQYVQSEADDAKSSATQTLNEVLNEGNSAGTTAINMNNNDLNNVRKLELNNQESASSGQIVRDNSIGFLGNWGGNGNAVLWDAYNVNTNAGISVTGGTGDEDNPQINLDANDLDSSGNINDFSAANDLNSDGGISDFSNANDLDGAGDVNDVACSGGDVMTGGSGCSSNYVYHDNQDLGASTNSQTMDITISEGSDASASIDDYQDLGDVLNDGDSANQDINLGSSNAILTNGGNDANHGIAQGDGSSGYTGIDGPDVFGYAGVNIYGTGTGQKITHFDDNGNVNIPNGGLDVSGSVSVGGFDGCSSGQYINGNGNCENDDNTDGDTDSTNELQDLEDARSRNNDVQGSIDFNSAGDLINVENLNVDSINSNKGTDPVDITQGIDMQNSVIRDDVDNVVNVDDNLDVAGDVELSGDVISDSGDVAEWLNASNVSQGDIGVIGDDGDFTTTDVPASYGARGVVTTDPAMVLGENASSKARVALTGTVPVNVVDQNGDIQAGDLLVTSSRPGHAMKARDKGMAIGTALEGFDGDDGQVKALLNVIPVPRQGGQREEGGSSDER